MPLEQTRTPSGGCPILTTEDGVHVDRRQLTFGEAMNRALMWMIAGLVSWLCYSTMSMQKQMAVMIERSDNAHTDMLIMRGEQQRLAATDQVTDSRIQAMEIKQAQHGWR